MSQIIPAIMPKNYFDLEDKVNLVMRHAPMVQIDIMDGVFVPNSTWPFPLPNPQFDAIQAEVEGLPMWEKINYELDLMVRHPDQNFEQWVKLGAARIIVHLESLADPMAFFESKIVQDMRIFTEIGISFDNGTGAEAVLPYLPFVDCVQVMGIARIGFQGNPFDDRSLYNIERIRKAVPTMLISVDGAVNRETIQKLKEAGADRFVVGSAVFEGGIVEENIRDLQDLVQ